MCVVCGCGNTGERDAAQAHERAVEHVRAQLRQTLDFGAGAARVSVPGMSQARAIQIEADVLGANARFAADNRAHFRARGVLALNLVSSPGSGKTTLLCAVIEALQRAHPALDVAVIEGDQQTSFDAERIRAAGAPAVQVNTGKGCHLDAQMVGSAFADLSWQAQGGVLFIENVGNLVCPALWDLGEQSKVVILSVTEGQDKPLKYPDMFAAAKLMVVNKVDLLPYVQFDVAQSVALARRVNPQIEVLEVSATQGTGLDAFIAWVMREHEAVLARPPDEARVAALAEQ
jgi:hydrogenase nickel incorporation protein HypB